MPFALLLLSAISLNAQTSDTLVLPLRPAPTLDGTVDPDEWRGSLSAVLPNGTRVLLMRDSSFAYVAVQASGPLFATLCLEQADTVSVLHASASLGTARYSLSRDGTAARISDFAWSLRGGLRQATASDRAEFLSRAGWLASTVGDAVSSREYQIRLSRSAASQRLAVAIVGLTGTGGGAWPPGVSDACSATGFAMGQAPLGSEFRVAAWGVLPRVR